MNRKGMMARASGLAMTVGLLTAAAGAHAADPAGDSSTTVSGVTVTGETVVTAPKVVPLSTTYSEGAMTADALRNLSPGATITIQTLLNKQPSIIAYTDGPLGSRTNIYFRAFNSQQFAETYGGVALNDVFNSGVTGQASVINNTLLLPSNVDSVEIFRGINNPLVNSYNSLGGTINYLPRRPADLFGGEIGGSYGSFNTKEFHLSIDTGDIHGLKQVLAFSHADSDGWAQNTSARNTNVYYSATYSPNAQNQLSAVFIYNHNNAYTPFNMPVPLLQQNGNYFQWPLDWTYEKDSDTSYMGILDYKLKISPIFSFENKIFGGNNDYRRTSYSNPAFQGSATQPYNLENDPSSFPFWIYFYPNGPTYNPVTAFPDANGDGQYGTDYHFYGYAAWGMGDTPTLTIALPSNTITIGGNITYGRLHSREYWYGAYNMPMIQGYNDAWDEHDSRLFASAFIQEDVSLLDDRLHITPGFKYIYAYTKDHDAIGFFYPIAGDVSDKEDFVSPTVGLNYKLTDHIAVYGSWGENVKFPEISAYYGAFQTDANGNNVIVPVKVNPEYVNDYELGSRFQQAGFSASINLYREDFTNTFISRFNAQTGTTSTVNGGTSRYQGVELQLAQDFGQQPWGDLSLYLNYSYNQAKFTSSFTSDYAGSVTAGAPLANVPDTLVNFGGVWSRDGWRVNVDGRYVGRQYLDQQNSGLPTQATIGAYFLVDLGISKTFELHNMAFAKSIKVAFNADNLTNKYYLNEGYTDSLYNPADGNYDGASFIRAVPGAPRSFTGSLVVGF